MEKIRHPKSFMGLLLSAAIMTLVSMQAVANEPQERPHLEMKGFHIGMTLDEAKAQAPNAVSVEHAPGIVECNEPHARFAGYPTAMSLKFLDGVFIDVTMWGLTREQAEADAMGLTTKFGKADIVSPDLLVPPFDKVSKKGGEYWAVVFLSNLNPHDHVWLPRYRGAGRVEGARRNLSPS